MAKHFTLLAIIVGCMFSASLGDITQGPLNDATLVGNDVTLYCESTTTGLERVQFLEYQTNPNGSLISDGATLLPGHPNYFRHELVTDVNAGTYSLKIRTTVLEDGGKYACRDAAALPNPSMWYSDLVVIAAAPNCTTTLPANRIVSVGAYYTAECIVNFRASAGINPFMLWSGTGDFTQALVRTNVSTWAGTAFNIQRVMDGRAFTLLTNFTDVGFGGPDTSTNVPTYSYTYSTGLLFVQYGPTNVTYAPIQSSYEIGQIITCYADAVPLPSYTWTNLITLVEYRSQSLTLTPDMAGDLVLRCQVVNSVSTADLFANITVNPITTPTTPTTTTPAPTIPAVAPCDDLTGRWEIQHDNGYMSVLCINVDRTQNALVRGLWWNDTNEPFFSEILGRTRNDEYDEIGFSTMWADRLGVTSFAGECHKCRGIEYLIINAISRSSSEQAFCQDGGTVLQSDTWTFNRKPITFPCSPNAATMEETAQKFNRRRRRRMAPRV